MLALSNRMMQAWCFVAAVMTASAACSQAELSHRVRVILLKRESSLHASVGNRDVYLLRVTPRRGASFDAVAIDSYPGYAEALPLRRLTKDVTFSLKLTRTPYCDRPVSGEGQEFSVRCFTIDHGSLRMPKNTTSDLWWK